jgi:hypothetical protein
MVDLPVPPLGVGLTYWPGAATFIADHIDLLDVIEVSPETLWYPDGYGGYVCDTTEPSAGPSTRDRLQRGTPVPGNTQVGVPTW